MAEKTPTTQNCLPHSDIYNEPWQALGAWFLGPRAENHHKLKEFTNFIVDEYSRHRKKFFPGDPSYITEDVKNSQAYIKEMEETHNKLDKLNKDLTDSIPLFSTRYQGHMIWETTLPSTLGYFLGMLWNQNNADSTVSPVTTQFEISVGQELCALIGFDEKSSPWGHITGCGSIANIEAMWSSRNMKFHPLAMQAACNSNPDLSAGGDFPVLVPELGKTVELKNCTTWQLLNLDVDVICSLTNEVNKFMSGGTVPDKDLTNKIEAELEKHSVVNIGMHEFCRIHKIGTDPANGIKNPVVLSPGTNHYSWPKGATVLGLGDRAILPIHVDKNARLDIEYLKNTLKDCKEKQIPVIMVVTVVGTTEESAVDPISDVYAVRNTYRAEGLNFAIHSDAAWGGYLLTMVQPPSMDRIKVCRDRGEDFVPMIPLSKYAADQYKNVRMVDTVTIDPHKAGLCHYPAGALCYRNGAMKNFIALAAHEIFHGENDVNVAIYGLEGSKPGAAACGVRLSHQVIGLDQMGYGRILGQCQLGAKLFYCMWMTVAREYDDFVCVNFIDVSQEAIDLISPVDVNKYIRENILGKDNRELYQDKKAMEFLKIVGPDALINAFVVNPTGNTNIDLCNKLQAKLFSAMNATVGQSPKRVPIFLTSSQFDPRKYGEGVDQLKRRLGFNVNPDDVLVFLRQTAINPFQASECYVTIFGELFRNACLNCIASMGEEGLPGADEPLNHVFVVVSDVDHKGRVFLDYCPSYAQLGSQYHVVVRMKIASDVNRFSKVKGLNSPMFLRTKSPMVMFNLLRNYVVNNAEKKVLQFDALEGKIDGKVISDLGEVDMYVEDVFRYNRLESLKASEEISYPEHAKYFLYGDKNNAYLSHVISKHKDFHQVVKLDEIPLGVTHDLLDYGLIITIPEINGNPLNKDGTIHDPLQSPTYDVEFRGRQYVPCKTSIALRKSDAKIWFDSKHLNI